jgi:hypothetical protein
MLLFSLSLARGSPRTIPIIGHQVVVIMPKETRRV